MSMKVHLHHFLLLILLIINVTSCKKVTLSEDDTELLINNMVDYSKMIDQLNKTEINRLRIHLDNSPNVPGTVVDTYNQLQSLDDQMGQVFETLLDAAVYGDKNVYFTDIQLFNDIILKQINDTIDEFNDQVKPLSDEIYQAMILEQETLIEYLEGDNPAGVINLSVMKYIVQIKLLINRLIKQEAAFEKMPNAKINYLNPHFAIEMVPESNIVAEGDSLRFKLIGFTYFQANSDSVTFSYNNQHFTFGEDYATFKDEIPLRSQSPFREDIEIKSNYGLWLNGYSEYVLDEVKYQTQVKFIPPCK